jgi:uncharacterized protein (TIGR02594 family)
MSEPKWLELARGELGTKEIVGSKHNPNVLQYFRDVKNSGVKDDETSWCAAFAGAMLERSGIVSTRSLLARSYLQWGEKVDSPKPGDIVVFKRGNSSWQGHVTFFLYEKNVKIYCLGGNQSDSVNIQGYAKGQLLGYRRPKAISAKAVEKPSDLVLEAISKIGATPSQIPLNEYALWMGQSLTDENQPIIRGNREAMSTDTLAKIVTKNYWLTTSANKFGQAYASFILDTALEHGPQKTRLMMQRAVDAKDDGIIGPKTIAAIKAKAPKDFINAMIAQRTVEFKKKADWDVKFPDWHKRLSDLRDTLTGAKAKAIPIQPVQSAGPASSGGPVSDQVTKVPAQEPPAAQPATVTEKKMSTTPVEVKPWTQSLTIWGTIVTFASTVLPALAQLFGWDISAGDVQTVGTGVTTAIQAIGGVIGTVMAIIGRTKATAPVKFFG